MIKKILPLLIFIPIITTARESSGHWKYHSTQVKKRFESHNINKWRYSAEGDSRVWETYSYSETSASYTSKGEYREGGEYLSSCSVKSCDVSWSYPSVIIPGEKINFKMNLNGRCDGLGAPTCCMCEGGARFFNGMDPKTHAKTSQGYNELCHQEGDGFKNSWRIVYDDARAVNYGGAPYAVIEIYTRASIVYHFYTWTEGQPDPSEISSVSGGDETDRSGGKSGNVEAARGITKTGEIDKEKRLKRGDAAHLMPQKAVAHEEKFKKRQEKLKIIDKMLQGKEIKESEAPSSWLAGCRKVLSGLGHFAAAIQGDFGRMLDFGKMFKSKKKKDMIFLDKKTQEQKSMYTAVTEFLDMTIGKVTGEISNKIGGGPVAALMNVVSGYYGDDVKGVVADNVYGKDKALVLAAKVSAKNLKVSEEGELMRTLSTNVDEASYKRSAGGFIGTAATFSYKLIMTGVQKGLDFIGDKRRKSEAEKMDRIYRVLSNEIKKNANNGSGGKVDLNKVMRRMEKQGEKSTAWRDLQNDLLDTYPPQEHEGRR
jgi:hypothetical protein